FPVRIPREHGRGDRVLSRSDSAQARGRSVFLPRSVVTERRNQPAQKLRTFRGRPSIRSRMTSRHRLATSGPMSTMRTTALKAAHDIAIAVTGVASRLIPDRVPMTLLGAGSSRDLCSAIAEAGVKKALVVTDAVLVKLGIVARITSALEECGVATCVYDGVEPDPTSDHVAAGLAMLKRERCDAIVAIGGGSPMDAAKVISAAATNDKPLRKLEGLLKVRRQPVPLYAIPTTAGTGSEVTIAAVVSDPVTHAKKFFVDPKLLPLMTALDPELMVGLPPAVTAATGMDALTHAIESYLSKTSNQQTERWESAAIRLIFT